MSLVRFLVEPPDKKALTKLVLFYFKNYFIEDYLKLLLCDL